ncbi:MAG TPA: imidazole glycerol phosphate synthase subunit HisH [Beijerinckiaceae bacterium]|nr:imidazole glycerol phosphate synthase subunit HisH [Beijerinckiaceae bacterium]
MGTLAIVDYGSGNLHSAKKAFERAARSAEATHSIVVTADPQVVRNAERIVLPGVGAFADCRAGLGAIDGMIETLGETVVRRGRPFLGICVGMQLMASRGLEYATTQGLGWIPGDVAAIRPSDPRLKIPHMGWNNLKGARHPVFDRIPLGEIGWHGYFVHSFQFEPIDPDHIVAETEYGGPIVAAVGRDNMVGTQFHPEKSQKLGLALIGNFLGWRP